MGRVIKNRDYWRTLKKMDWQTADRVFDEALDKQLRENRELYVKEAYASLFLALHEQYGFNKWQMMRIAERTIGIVRDALCPEEIVMELLEKSGFDVRIRTDEYDYSDEPKGDAEGDAHD